MLSLSRYFFWSVATATYRSAAARMRLATAGSFNRTSSSTRGGPDRVGL
jgi:hypothetical protein